MIKIYFGPKPVFLVDRITPEVKMQVSQPGCLFIENPSAAVVSQLQKQIQHPDSQSAVLLHHNIAELKEEFWKQFTTIKAGGGAVWNEEGELLFIHRRGKWDLPKGKLEEGETIEDCAVREVEEETGLQTPQLQRHILTTYHHYTEKGIEILKESYWFEMRITGHQETTPQTIEDITAIRWLAPDQWKQVRLNTFPSIADVLDELNR